MEGNFILDFLKNMVLHNIDFVVCGGIACVLQGCERTTFDIDIAISFEKENLKRFVDFVKKVNLKPRINEPVESLMNEEKRKKWITEKNAFVYTLTDEYGILQLDIFLQYPIDYETLSKNANIFIIKELEIKVSSKKDLIKAKESISPLREKDLKDIQELKRLIDGQN